MIDSLYRQMDAEPMNADDNPHAPWPVEPLCCSFHYPTSPEPELEPEEPTCWVCDGYHGNRGCPVDAEPRGSWFGFDPDDRY